VVRKKEGKKGWREKHRPYKGREAGAKKQGWLEWGVVAPSFLELGLGERLSQCYQWSGAPVGPDWMTAKNPGRDGTAKCYLFSSSKPKRAAIAKDSGPYNVRQIGVGDYGGLWGDW